jgi:hypothetical protein
MTHSEHCCIRQLQTSNSRLQPAYSQLMQSPKLSPPVCPLHHLTLTQHCLETPSGRVRGVIIIQPSWPKPDSR